MKKPKILKKVNPQFRGVYSNKNVDKIPILFMMVGLPGSGKSYLADGLHVERKEVTKPNIHSSDTLRKELYGDEDEQKHNAEIFSELHKRIKNDLQNNKDVIYDATNINKKKRRAFLSELKNIPCYKVCLAVMTPYEYCLKQNTKRKRKVPEHIIRKMYLNWNPPSYDEGFDDIILCYNFESNKSQDKYTLDNFFAGDIGADYIDQENKHHTYTIGEHCRATGAYLKEHYPEDTLLHTAGLLHDIGKVFTKSPFNSKGERDGDCHYYQHHCVGAYDSLFYTWVIDIPLSDKIEIANLIYYHMMPFTSWKQSEKAKNKSRNQIGEKMFDKVMKLHEADLAAH